MPITLLGATPATFEIKSASLPLLTLRLKSADMNVLTTEFAAHYDATPDFFEDDLLLIDLAHLPEDTTTVDFTRLKALLMHYRLQPIAVTAGRPEFMAAALQADLPAAPSGWREMQSQQRSATPVPQAISPELITDLTTVQGALIVNKPLRSGQQVYARGRDLVLLAVCNPGAEAIADGHIHIYAPMRGRAIAGARGWNEARIFALDMRPELVSIAGIYRTSEQGLAPEVWGRAATVRLAATADRDTLVFEPLT
ncbi:MAG: septum site-determining protein MinC [Burkholderiaceae bacterium]|jgi:septum site-determining protein MinC|nr:septum site-determining protein MinC [Burkholderiaceae bacterium]